MKRNDWILAGAVLAGAIVFFLINSFVVHREGARVRVTVGGEEYGSYSLEEELDLDIESRNGVNHLVIHDGKADMTQADCPDRLCVHQKAISRDRETIVCLPNQVVVEIIGGEEAELDSIAN